MSPRYDLHSHSTASDGTLAPAELVRRAAAAGVDVLALTDHDTLDGLAEAVPAAAAAGVALVPGVEVSVSWRGLTVHVLGLGVDPAHRPLAEGLRGLSDYREWRAAEIGRRLEKRGIGGALEGARAHAHGRIVGRTHFARFLVDSGRAASVGEVFKRYLVKGRPGYVRGDWAALDDAVGWIRGAGGIAVVAHPARYRLTRSKLGHLLHDFQAAGGEGLEVVSGSHSRDQTLHMAAVARSSGLLASCGSDYHGPENPWIELGRLRALPNGCTPVWQHPNWPLAAATAAEPAPA
ncbi:MAG TPA: PHP domain-containing protein [Gammaproteobacteria bacterium]|nr:PHP domain-containing protein [Gammaproteobacteria bacterium]